MSSPAAWTWARKKSVLYQAKLDATGLFSPPYGALIDRMLGLLNGPHGRL